MEPVLSSISANLELLADNVMKDLPAILRNKYEQLITELVHQRDAARAMMSKNMRKINGFRSKQRFYYFPGEKEGLK